MKVKLIIGLGNPSKEYQKTYHNIGFTYLDFLARGLSKDGWRKAGKGLFEYLKSDGPTLAKTLVFMNDSGIAVKAALGYLKCKPHEMLVVHDDSDIELEKYKLSFGRGSAGHRGVESVIRSLKTSGFWRLRIGIRKISKVKSQKSKIRPKAGDLVLGNVSPADRKTFQTTFETINFFSGKLTQNGET